MATRTLSAHLTAGRMSEEARTTNPPSSLQNLMEEVQHQAEQLGGSERSLGWGQEQEDLHGEEAYPLTRPAWQAFLVTLQLQFPEMGAEINPAHKIGKIPPVRVLLSQDALEFLNLMIIRWYDAELELTTLTYDNPRQPLLTPTQEVLYQIPYRPVTGLNLIVTPTVQQSLVPREKKILQEKEKWNHSRGLEGIIGAYHLMVKEKIPCSSPASSGKKKTLIGKWLLH